MRIAIIILVTFLLGFNKANAQFSKPDSVIFEAYEDTINALSDTLFYSNVERNRILASFAMIQQLKNALKRSNSFEYSFPNLKAISQVKPKDESFKIFTWQLVFDNNSYKYFGALQMNSEELILLPLIDKSEDIKGFETLSTSNKNWIGALYYNIKKIKSGKDSYYLLFGFDGNNTSSTKKILDPLWFDEENNVHFGAPIITSKEGKTLSRFILEFRKGSSAGLKYSDELKKVVFDHLIPMDPEVKDLPENYVSDGSYDGFEWKKGKLLFVEKIYDYKLENGEFPRGN